ncbi:hypothetical protein FRX31_033558 [Thalictrum thalictroides]|uniref:Uncharacterized protein n=1 Tax=Thalictrum thalictroides TaxID=46969 RepID=A0A7J6UW81_THATH|nr:hypothetical protein FRX31_033558 [Thalictrum thalictroides]
MFLNLEFLTFRHLRCEIGVSKISESRIPASDGTLVLTLALVIGLKIVEEEELGRWKVSGCVIGNGFEHVAVIDFLVPF